MTDRVELINKNKEDVLHAYRVVVAETSVEQIEGIRAKFLDRFGPQVLQAASGKDLLEIVHGDGFSKGMFYDLEFGNTADTFGSVAGGSSLKYKVYRAADGAFRRKGAGSTPVPCSETEAIQITEAIVGILLKGVSLADQLRLDSGNADAWTQFDEEVAQLHADWPGRGENEQPILYLGWAHKYLALVHSGLFAFHHQTRALAQHMVRLGVVPDNTQRYLLDFQWYKIRSQDADICYTHPALWMKACYAAFDGGAKYWRINTQTRAPESEVSRWPTMRNGSFVSIDYGSLGNVRELLEGSKGAQAVKRIKAILEDAAVPSKTTAKEWLNFYQIMKPGDRIAAMEGQMLHGVGVISGQYEFVPDDLQPHHRHIEWHAEVEEECSDFPKSKSLVYDFSDKYSAAAQIERFVTEGEGLTGEPPVDLTMGMRSDFGIEIESPLEIADDTYQITPLAEMEQRIADILDRKGQVILYGPPGTGKTYHARRTAQELISREICRGRDWASLTDTEKNGVNQRIHFCTFHPAYSYEDFVEGYRPRLENGTPSFELRHGLFRRACDAARAEPTIHHVLIIDEINRGNIPAIMGELITLLEEDKRETLSVTLPISGDIFTVPRNLWLLGTMNIADRSISLLDAALRRRFGFVELMPDTSLIEMKIGDLSPAALLITMNERIRRYVTRNARELQIGHAYFMRNGHAIQEKGELLQVIRDDIIPLISEYCFEDYRTMARILGDEIIDTNLLVPAAAVMNNADAMYLALLRLVSAEGAPAAREDTSMDIAA